MDNLDMSVNCLHCLEQMEKSDSESRRVVRPGTRSVYATILLSGMKGTITYASIYSY